MINRGGPSLVVRIADQTGAAAGRDRRRLRRGARQLRHDRAQRRDRRARQQDRRQGAARALRGGAGPAARPPGLVPAQCRPLDRGWRPSSSITAPASRRWQQRSTPRCRRTPPTARAARADGTGRGGRAGGAGAPHRRVCRRWPPRPTSCWSPTAPQKPMAAIARPTSPPRRFFQLDRIVDGGARHRGHRLFRPARARPRARLDRRRRAPAHRGDGGDRRRRARPRSRPGSSRAQAEVERIRAAMHEIAGTGLTLSKLVGGGEPAGRSGRGLRLHAPAVIARACPGDLDHASTVPPTRMSGTPGHDESGRTG